MRGDIVYLELAIDYK